MPQEPHGQSNQEAVPAAGSSRQDPASLLPGEQPDRRDIDNIASLKAGFLAGSPLLIGIIPFALIYGAAARETGLTLIQTVSMSLSVFAGSAQLIFVNLWAQQVTVPVLVLTCLAVNLRLLIYGASMSLRLEPPKGPAEALVRSYLLTDESFAVSMSGFYNPGFGYRRLAYYLGSGLPTWLGWQSFGLAGYLAGAVLPESRPIGVAVPLIFLALLISIIRTSSTDRRPRLISAAAAGLLAVLLKGLPLNLGLMAAIIVGILAGLFSESFFRPRRIQ
jgi:predicted branched-subunit amino acid permease